MAFARKCLSEWTKAGCASFPSVPESNVDNPCSPRPSCQDCRRVSREDGCGHSVLRLTTPAPMLEPLRRNQQDHINEEVNHPEMLQDLLVEHREQVLQKWFEHVLDSYPSDSKKFFKSQKNRFANPVGAALSEGLDGLYDKLVAKEEPTADQLIEFLDRIVRVRAVQEFGPSQSLAFVPALKYAVRSSLEKEIKGHSLWEELLTFEARIDKLMLLSFDLYMQCRETIFQIRRSEIKDSTERLWQRVCRKYGIPEELPEPHNDDSSPR
jgi:hypothetical protein